MTSPVRYLRKSRRLIGRHRADADPATIQAVLDDDGDGVVIYAYGLIALSACAPASMTAGQVASEVNRLHPTGIESPWTPDPAPAFKGGEPNPAPCDRNPESRQHWLFQC